jgi:hypothetical protein
VFYIAQWEENITGVIKTHVDNVGVTEFQFIGMAIIILPAFIGHTLNETKILDIDLVRIILYINVFV